MTQNDIDSIHDIIYRRILQSNYRVVSVEKLFKTSHTYIQILHVNSARQIGNSSNIEKECR